MLLYPWYLWTLASKEARDGAVAALKRLFHWWMCWGRPVTRCVCVYIYLFFYRQKNKALCDSLTIYFGSYPSMSCWEISTFTNYSTNPREVGNQCLHWALHEWDWKINAFTAQAQEVGKSMPSPGSAWMWGWEISASAKPGWEINAFSLTEYCMSGKLGNQCIHRALHGQPVKTSFIWPALKGHSFKTLLLTINPCSLSCQWRKATFLQAQYAV